MSKEDQRDVRLHKAYESRGRSHWLIDRYDDEQKINVGTNDNPSDGFLRIVVSHRLAAAENIRANAPDSNKNIFLKAQRRPEESPALRLRVREQELK